MTFNHYAKIKKILSAQPNDWIIRKIDSPTTSKKFNGETVKYPYYYRIYDSNNKPIKYCKFQQIDRLAKTLNKEIEDLNII